MTLGQAKCFLTVADENSFAKAANVLFVSQPAVSKSISKLEEELGFLLLDRKSDELRLTPAGRKLYDFFVKTQCDYQSVIGEIHQIIKESAGMIRLGCPDMYNPNMFYHKIMNHFLEIYPSIRLEIECIRPPELLGRLQAGRLELVMSHEFYPPVQYGCSVRHLTDTGCGILYSKKHFRNIRSLADLNGVDFLMFDVDTEKKYSMVMKRVCSDYGFVPNIKNYDWLGAVEFNMSCGKGVMFCTEWDKIVTNSSYDYLPVPYRSPVNLIYQSASANTVTNLVVDELITLFS
jgi:hypothetical protein